MQLHCTIQEGQISLGDAEEQVLVEPTTIRSPAKPSR
jgi:hypothetical protein